MENKEHKLLMKNLEKTITELNEIIEDLNDLNKIYRRKKAKYDKILATLRAYKSRGYITEEDIPRYDK